MEKCSPAEMRKNVNVVEAFKKRGIDFVAVPVIDSNHKNALIARCNEILEAMASLEE